MMRLPKSGYALQNNFGNFIVQSTAMRSVFLFLLSCCIIGCARQSNEVHQLNTRIDSLGKELTHTYKPGLGEFMSGIQVHHAKLWFAGQAQNWPLAYFEIGEIKETLDDIREYNADRPEVRSLIMIVPAIDSITHAIQQKDPQLFKSSFVLLTNTCNNCHFATHHEFNVIKIPDTPPFSNQEFKAQHP